MRQAVGLQFYFAAYEPRALPWAGMSDAVGVTICPNSAENAPELVVK
jgi:hypothetical protein